MANENIIAAGHPHALVAIQGIEQSYGRNRVLKSLSFAL